MEHVVFSAAADGAGEEFRRVSSLEEALRVVEHLRNEVGVENPSVFALTPVPLSFRTYYRVELPDAEPAAVSEPVSEPEPALPVDEFAEDFEAPVAEAASDEEFVYDGGAYEGSADEVAAILPEGAIPSSRQDVDGERSLGYFAR